MVGTAAAGARDEAVSKMGEGPDWKDRSCRSTFSCRRHRLEMSPTTMVHMHGKTGCACASAVLMTGAVPPKMAWATL